MQKLNDLFIFMSGIGYNMTSAQVLKDPLKDRRGIWQIILHVARWCRGLKTSALLDWINPLHAMWIDVKLHEASVRWDNQLCFLQTLIRQLRIPITLVDLMKPQRDKIILLIDRLREYGTKRKNILTNKKSLLTRFNTAKIQNQKLNNENQKSKLHFQEEQARRKKDQPQCQNIILKDKENRAQLEQVKQIKENVKSTQKKTLMFKKGEIELKINSKKSGLETRRQNLQRLRMECLKCLPNIEEKLESQKRSGQQHNNQIDAEIEEKMRIYNRIKQKLADVQRMFRSKLEQANDSSANLNSNVAVIEFLSATKEDLKMKNIYCMKQTQNNSKIEALIAQLQKKSLDAQGTLKKIETDLSVCTGLTNNLRNKYSRQLGNSTRLKETKHIVEGQQNSMSQEIQEIRRNFLARKEKLQAKITEYTSASCKMIQAIYKDVRDIHRSSHP